MSVIDILKIEEVDHVYTLKFRLILEWYFCLKIYSLKSLSLIGMTTASNT